MKMKSPVPLQNLDGKELNESYTISLDIKPRAYAEQKYFEIYLVDKKKGTKSKDPIFSGVYSEGRKSANIRGWVDGDYFEEVEFPSEKGKKVNLSEIDLDVKLFKLLGELVPPGGSLMVSYEMFYGKSRIHEETEKSLIKGFPIVSTPIGYLLFKAANCGLGLKNWYIPEGGFEGNQKIQGFKALNEEHEEKRLREMKEEIEKFLNKKREKEISEIEQNARKRAKEILEFCS